MLPFFGGGGMHPEENFGKKSALRLNLEAILANNTDHSEEFDSLPSVIHTSILWHKQV